MLRRWAQLRVGLATLGVAVLVAGCGGSGVTARPQSEAGDHPPHYASSEVTALVANCADAAMTQAEFDVQNGLINEMTPLGLYAGMAETCDEDSGLVCKPRADGHEWCGPGRCPDVGACQAVKPEVWVDVDAVWDHFDDLTADGSESPPPRTKAEVCADLARVEVTVKVRRHQGIDGLWQAYPQVAVNNKASIAVQVSAGPLLTRPNGEAAAPGIREVTVRPRRTGHLSWARDSDASVFAGPNDRIAVTRDWVVQEAGVTAGAQVDADGGCSDSGGD